ncbi:MAG: hypothetical protein IKU19_02930, partial [Clostridia bacterium]|nr:hypothetical protein [Clostridia bacterium]
MYNVTQAYRSAIDSGAVQHIRGSLLLASGDEVDITELIEGTPKTDSRSVESDDRYMFGEMYVGSVEVIIRMDAEVSDFKGAQLSLDFGVDITGEEEPEWVPLGVWDVTSAERTAVTSTVGKWNVKGMDHLNRLRTLTENDTIGFIRLETALAYIAEKSGVTFAQTAAQIAALAGRANPNTIYTVQLASTCWEQVRQIAQIVGGFAFANRDGEIEFRKPAKTSSLTIAATRRFGLKLSEHAFYVAGVSYTDDYGRNYTKYLSGGDGTAVLGFSKNAYITTESDNFDSVYASWIDPIANYYNYGWYSGTCDYYGDPALDLGDLITVQGGIAGTTGRVMLVTGISWKFRGQQTLTSAGVPDTGAVDYSAQVGSSSGGGTGDQIIMTKPVKTVWLDCYDDELTGERQTVARGGISCRSAVDCYADIGLVFKATQDCTATVRVYLDGIAQIFQPIQTLHEGEYTTLHFNVDLSPAAGTHTVEVKAVAYAEIADIRAIVRGQDITEASPDLTLESDYTYTIADGKATVTGYTGSSIYPQIPNRLGGSATTIIGVTAFTES